MRAFLHHHSPIRGLSVVRTARATPLWHRYSTDSKEFLPDHTTPVTTELSFFDSVRSGPIPAFRILDRDGSLLDGAQLPEMDKELALRLYKTMNLLPILDTLLYSVQRQGKIPFYMTTHGEEAAIVGSAAGFDDTDEALGQYREMGVLLWRGFTLNSVMAQCLGNHEDLGKARQMPVHFGSKDLHFHTISSTLATQIPHAAGVGYALKRDPERRGKSCAVVHFGEGAASEGDFHAGMLMASVLGSPTVFFCRNNGFAISTPASEQYVGDGIAARGPGYGVKTIRVDGNDVLAVLSATRAARELAIGSEKPVLVEAMTYRVGHHSTSDDSFAYRGRQEVEQFKKTDNPLHRMKRFLEQRSWWDEEKDEEMKNLMKKEVLDAFRRGENLSRNRLSELFGDIYGDGVDDLPWTLREQRTDLANLLKKYGDCWGPWRAELAKFQGKGEDVPLPKMGNE